VGHPAQLRPPPEIGKNLALGLKREKPCGYFPEGDQVSLVSLLVKFLEILFQIRGTCAHLFVLQ
jgi:hypothetical protein